MIPIRDVVPVRTAPLVTTALIGVHLVVFAVWLVSARNGAASSAFLHAWGYVPAEAGPLRAFTSLFLHGGLIHISANVLALWVFGGTVEDRLGHARFLTFYVVTGLVGLLVDAWLVPARPTPLLASSGAVAGVLGAYLALFPKSKVLVLVPLGITWEVIEIPATWCLLLWFGLQVLGNLPHPLDMAGTVAFSMPAAGLTAGLALVWVFRRRERLRVEWWSA